MATYYWFCKKCMLVERIEGRIQDKPPAEYGGCKHNWTSYNPKTVRRYMCKKCHATVSLPSGVSPSQSSCKHRCTGGTHTWVKM